MKKIVKGKEELSKSHTNYVTELCENIILTNKEVCNLLREMINVKADEVIKYGDSQFSDCKEEFIVLTTAFANLFSSHKLTQNVIYILQMYKSIRLTAKEILDYLEKLTEKKAVEVVVNGNNKLSKCKEELVALSAIYNYLSKGTT